jgi:hypothetical protein
MESEGSVSVTVVMANEELLISHHRIMIIPK